MVVRTICGAGRQTGPQHGQSLEAWLVHVPGLKVVWGSNPADARGLLKAAIRDPNPVCFMEHKGLYRHVKGEVPAGDHAVRVPVHVGPVRLGQRVGVRGVGPGAAVDEEVDRPSQPRNRPDANKRLRNRWQAKT